MKRKFKTLRFEIPILLLAMLMCIVLFYAQKDEGKLRKLYAENKVATISILMEKIRNGSSAEKEEALWLFLDQKIIDLIPAVIDAIGDPTLLPRHGDTGWGFVAHQASSSLGTVAQSLDGLSPKIRDYDQYSFYNDMYKGSLVLKNSGRLSEVQANWGKWWQDFILKQRKRNSLRKSKR